MKLPLRMSILVPASLAGACLAFVGVQSVGAQNAGEPEEGLYAFESEEALEAFAAQMQELAGRQYDHAYASDESEIMVTGTPMAVPAPPPPPPPPAAMPSMAMESARSPEPVSGEQITNTQEAGVDEGAIVKDAGDYLVILRRGRIFTVRHGGNALEPVAAINAFPPGAQNASNTWYDEMLVRGDQVIVVGYSYGDFGTEINRFRLGRDGSLTYRDTHYLRSGDYYSSSNYASRMIGDELIFYAPVSLQWNNWRATMPALRRGGPGGEVVDLVEPEDVFVTQPARRGKFYLPMAHAVTRCDLSAEELQCDATAVLGSWSRVFYVSPRAVYLWTSAISYAGGEADGQLYRLPLDGSRPGSVPVSGGPIDQFSFTEDAADNVLRVVLRGEGQGDAMWGSEFSGGDLGLLTVPLGAFTDGSERMPMAALRELPPVAGYQFQNRFVGDYLLYAASNYGNASDARFFYAAPVDGRAAQRVELEHGVTRIDVMGSDAIAIGPGSGNALGFSAVSLVRQARVEDVYMLPAASEGEVRSQAFFYRADPGSPGGVSGTLGLPVSRTRTGTGGEFLGNASAIFFLRRDNREFNPAGDLVSRAKSGVSDNCIASCVDWYGNARPIFLRERIFALLGYELVEGRIEDGAIREVRRTNFTPRASRRE
ncbi:MAG: beta-propeller domain-containing protein [Erythrobacter sp.]|nr:MAG: beta-propeller domain-containing protein [Erythrobacter sp.]